MRWSSVGRTVLIVLLVSACSPRGDSETPTRATTREPTPSSPPPASSPASSPEATSPFCRRLLDLDARLRVVRSYDDRTASVDRYRADVAALDRLYRRVEATAPGDADLAPLTFANGRFGEIVRAMPPDLSGVEARVQVALIIEAYNAGLVEILLDSCGPTILGAESP